VQTTSRSRARELRRNQTDAELDYGCTCVADNWARNSEDSIE